MRNLPQCIVTDINFRGLTFGDHQWLHVSIIHQHIKAAFHAQYFDIAFQVYAAFRVIQMRNEIMSQVLPYPFFGRKQDIFFPEYIPDEQRITFTGKVVVKRGEDQVLQM